MEEQEMKELLRKHKIVPNADQEVDYKMPFFFNNLLLNEESLIIIGNDLWNVSLTHKRKFNDLAHFRAYQSNSAEPLSVIKRFPNKDNYRTSGECSAHSDKDEGIWCYSRRVKGENIWDFEGYNNHTNSCTVDYDWELFSKYFINRFGIWFSHDAELITLKGRFFIYNSRGINYETCSEPLSKSETDDWCVSDYKLVSCSSRAGEYDEDCEQESYGSNHGVTGNTSNHTAKETDSCTNEWNGFMSVSVTCL